MAVSQGPDAGLSLSLAAGSLGVSPAEVLSFLIRAGYLYRYTGVGRPRACVRWERRGLFVNSHTEVLITRLGLECIPGQIVLR